MNTVFGRRGGLLALLALVATPAAALAADAGGARKDVLDPDFVNTAVTAATFLALLAVLYKFAWGPIQTGLKAREDAQHGALEEARKAREEAAAMRTQVQAELAKAADQVRAMLDQARKDADALRASEKEAGVKDAAAERERAKREIEAAKDVALNEIYQQAVQLATSLSAKTIRRQLSAEDHSRLLDESIAELQAGMRG